MSSAQSEPGLASTLCMNVDESAFELRRLPVRRDSLTARALIARIALAVFVEFGAASTTTAQTAPTVASSDTPPAGFGGAVPSERFVHEFQRRVILELQSTLSQASREQDERLRRFEEKQNQRLRQQSETLQRSIDELRGRLAEHSSVEPSDAPRINVRRVHDTRESVMAPAEAGQLAPEPTNTPLTHGLLPKTLAPRRNEGPGANLSPHGFVEGRLLNGVVAVVGGAERESIVALTGRYQAANGFVTDLNGCFALVQGRPDMPAGRIDFKVSRLTCNFADGASKTWDVSGWLVDADGIRGIKAQIVQNVGRKAIVASAGGALSGFGRRLSQEQYQLSAGPFASSSTFVGNATHDALGGSASGAASALEQSIAEYYNLYAPSLQVGGGTPASLVIANELKFPSSGRLLTQTHTATP
jgi:TolA-binding protein